MLCTHGAGIPSRTAHEAATHRAAHQLLEHGRVHSDPLALRILGEAPDAVAQAALAQPKRRELRLFIAARQRFAEDTLAVAVERGVRQLPSDARRLGPLHERQDHWHLAEPRLSWVVSIGAWPSCAVASVQPSSMSVRVARNPPCARPRRLTWRAMVEGAHGPMVHPRGEDHD
jgi:hypothetical protein